MNYLIDYGAYFSRSEKSIEPEKMNFLKVETPDSDAGRAKNQTGFKKTSSLNRGSISARSQSHKGSPFKFGPERKSKDNYSKAISNLDHTVFSVKSQMNHNENTMMENLRRGLVAGHIQINA